MCSDFLTVRTGRRVVTGHDEDGKSMIWLDGEVPGKAIFESEDGRTAHVVWATDEVPTVVEKKHDPMLTWFPEHEWFPKTGIFAGIFTWQPGSSYPMHASETVDVLFILSGEIELVLEKESTVLRPGDCVIQRGTQHAWNVVRDKPCIFVGFSIAKKQEDE